MLNHLIESLRTCPIVKRGEYNYFIHPITDGVPLVEPALLREVAAAMVKVMDLEGVKKIVVMEAMGIHIGVALSLITDIPLNIVRKRSYQLPGEVAVHQTTGYSKGELYINGIEAGDRVAIIDDVYSTGGTMDAVVRALEGKGVDIADICVVIRRGESHLHRPFKALAEIDVTEQGVHVISTLM